MDFRDMTGSASILVVDDTAANRDLLVRHLERQGYDTATADSGRDALAKIEREPFDLILLDIMMPEMSGFEVLERLKADAQRKHLPVILISAMDDVESMAKGIAMGADDYLPKPFNRHILKARVSASLAKKRMHDSEQMYARSLEREFEIAREIQSGFLPRSLPEADGWELAAWFQPARRVGGDFYDAFELSGGRIALVVADVCDKGVGAALFMALFRSLLRASAERELTADGDTASEVCRLVDGVNSYVARTHGDANMFATLCMVILDPASGEAIYVNCGHESPVITGSRGIQAQLPPTGPAAGILPDLHFACGTATLGAGDALVLFTDGITDARDATGGFFSRERLLDLIGPEAASAQAMVQRIRAGVETHARDVVPFDDITLLVVRRTSREVR